MQYLFRSIPRIFLIIFLYNILCSRILAAIYGWSDIIEIDSIECGNPGGWLVGFRLVKVEGWGLIDKKNAFAL
jgi:hypothetical protein